MINQYSNLDACTHCVNEDCGWCSFQESREEDVRLTGGSEPVRNCAGFELFISEFFS